MKKLTFSRDLANCYEVFLSHPIEFLNFISIFNKEELPGRYISKVVKMLNYFQTIKFVKREVTKDGIAIKIIFASSHQTLYLLKKEHMKPFIWAPYECYVNEMVRFFERVKSIVADAQNIKEITDVIKSDKYRGIKIMMVCGGYIRLKYYDTVYISVYKELQRGMNCIPIEAKGTTLFLGNVGLVIYKRKQ